MKEKDILQIINSEASIEDKMATKVQVTTPAQHDAKLPVVRSFLVDIAKKHNVRIDDLIVGMIGNSMHVWRYDPGANNPFQQLEIVEF